MPRRCDLRWKQPILQYMHCSALIFFFALLSLQRSLSVCVCPMYKEIITLQCSEWVRRKFLPCAHSPLISYVWTKHRLGYNTNCAIEVNHFLSKAVVIYQCKWTFCLSKILNLCTDCKLCVLIRGEPESFRHKPGFSLSLAAASSSPSSVEVGWCVCAIGDGRVIQ